MAVATPVLDRQILQKQSEMSADELHNSQIKEKYKRLIDPELNINEVRGGVVAPEKSEQTAEVNRTSILRPAQQPVQQSRPAQTAQNIVRPEQNAQSYFVTNARADADIFRADSAINQRRIVATEAPSVAADDIEDEDLRPTSTTIQYKTLAESDRLITKTKAAEESESHILGKREKVIIATFISVVVALFILVIVNSAVIAGLNSELSVIQDGVTAAREMLSEVNSQIQAATSMENIALYAQTHGLTLL